MLQLAQKRGGDMSMTAVIAFCSIVLIASIVHGVSGFAFGLIVLMVFPYIFGYTKALALLSFMALFIVGLNAWMYRKHVDWKWIPKWMMVYVVMDLLGILILKRVGDHPIWYTLLGCVFILMAVYLLWGQKRFRIKISGYSMVALAAMSGLFTGAFCVGGPPVVAFFLEATDSKESYLGTSQVIFFLTGIIDFSMRVLNGMFTTDLFSYALIGVVFMVIGLLIAKWLVVRIDALTMRRIICGIMVISGITMFLH